MVIGFLASASSSFAMPSSSFEFHADLHVLECRNVFRDRLVERDLPLLGEHHDRHARDRLAHGVDAEDRILGHRRLGFGIEHADGFEIGDLAIPHDERDGARDGALRTFAAQPLRDAVEPFGRQSDLARPCGGQVLRRQTRERRKNQNERKSQRLECTHVAPPIEVRFRSPRAHRNFDTMMLTERFQSQRENEIVISLKRPRCMG